MLAIPPCRNEDAQEQDDDADEHRRHGLGDGDVERSLLSLAGEFHNLPLVVALGGDGEVVGPHPIPIAVGMVLELGTTEDVPPCGAVHDDRQVDDHRLVAHVSDMPLVGVLDVLEDDVRDVEAFPLLLGGHGRRRQP